MTQKGTHQLEASIPEGLSSARLAGDAVRWNPGWGCWLELTRVAWPLHVTRASSRRGGWAQEQEIGLAWKPAGRHFLQVTGKAVAEPRLSQRWVGRCSGHGWSELCKEFGGQCFKSPAGFILISSVSVLVTTPFSDGEMAGSHVD